MVPFIDELKKLLEKDGDELTKLRLAYGLMLELKEISQYDLDDLVCYEDRRSDEPADELLSDIFGEGKTLGIHGTGGRI